jgi:hypothetical protein
MRARASKICLIVFAVLFFIAPLLLSVPGDSWQWYSVMAGFAIVPIILGPNRYRGFGLLALAVSVFLIISDIQSGKTFREKKQHMREAQHLTNAP